MSLHHSGAIAILLFACSSAHAQAPRPEYSKDDVVKAFSCEKQGLTTASDGSCQPPLGETRGFSLRTGAELAKPAEPMKPSSRVGSAYKKAIPTQPRPAKGIAKHDLLITFANASADITPQGKANAHVFAQALNDPRLAAARFAIDGHTNAVGNAAYNLELSRRRANAVAEYLVSQGVQRSRLEVQGYGFDRPANIQNPRASANRRVEARRLD